MFAAAFDQTLLRPDAASYATETFCDEGLQISIGTVCVIPAWVSLAQRRLQGSPVQTLTVCGFPLGATLIAAIEC